MRVRSERGLDDGTPKAARGAQGLQGSDGSVDGRVRALERWEQKDRQDAEDCQHSHVAPNAARFHWNENATTIITLG